MSEQKKPQIAPHTFMNNGSVDMDDVAVVSSPIPVNNEAYFQNTLLQFYKHPSVSAFAQKSNQLSPNSSLVASSLRNIPVVKKRSKKYGIVAISDALTDVVVNIDDKNLKELGLTKGASFPINPDIKQKIALLLDKLPHTKIPGGSPTNTIHMCANLGLRCAYVGCVGSDDEEGYDYINALRTNEIDTYVSIKKGNSAICYTFITPDGQRSFGIDFGVTKQLEEYEILHSLIEESQFLHFSAYELRGDTPLYRATMYAVEVARMTNTLITIDMGDAFLIDLTRDKLMKLFEKKVTIIFANEDEADAFCHCGKFAKKEEKKEGEKKEEEKKEEEKEGEKEGEKNATPPSSTTGDASSSSQTVSATPDASVSSPPSSDTTEAPFTRKIHSSFEGSPILDFTNLANNNLNPTVINSLFVNNEEWDGKTVVYGKGSAPNAPPFPHEWLQFLKYTELLVVKRGEAGALAITNKGVAFYCPAYNVEQVIDANGAGDNFQAGFFYGVFRGLPIPLALKIGSFIASRVIRMRGAQPHVRISGVEFLI